MIYVFEIDRRFWDSQHVSALVHEVLEASRRAEKGVDVAREVVRLGIALRSIEQAVFGQCGTPRLLEGSTAMAVVEALPRIGAVRLPFTVDKTSSGYFVSAVPFENALPPTSARIADRPRRSDERVPAALSEPRRGDRQKVVNRISAARSGSGDVVLGNSRHVEVTRALRAYLHESDSEVPFSVRFIYKDGSAGALLSLRRHKKRNTVVATRELNVGLGSCRHFDLDAQVDMYLLRNAGIARRDDPTFGEQEAFAYERASAAFDTFCGNDGLHIRLFHVGLEPAVIGFYRAVIDALLADRPLRVTPVFYPSGSAGEAWW